MNVAEVAPTDERGGDGEGIKARMALSREVSFERSVLELVLTLEVKVREPPVGSSDVFCRGRHGLGLSLAEFGPNGPRASSTRTRKSGRRVAVLVKGECGLKRVDRL